MECVFRVSLGFCLLLPVSGLAENSESRTPLMQASGGELWEVITTVDGKVDPTPRFDISIPFARVYGQAMREISEIQPPERPWQGSIFGPLADGSTPTLVDSRTKFLFNVSLPPVLGVGGLSYQVGGLELPISAIMADRYGVYSEFDLDDLALHQRLSSTTLGEDLSVRYFPGEQQSAFELCLNVPGEAILTTPQGTSLISGRYSQSLEFTLGAAAFDFGRKCVALEWLITNPPESALYESMGTSLRAIFANAQSEPMQCRTAPPLDVLLPDILERERDSLLDRIKAGGLSEAKVEYARQSLGNGQWLIDVHGRALLKALGNAYATALREVFVRVGIPQTQREFRRVLADQCLLLQTSQSALWTDGMQRFCADTVGSLAIRALSWKADEQSLQAGCYEGYASIRAPLDSAGVPKWWTNKCRINTRFEVQGADLSAGDLSNLKVLLRNFAGEVRPSDWEESLLRLQVTDYELALLVEAWVAMGHASILPEDWDGELGAMVSRLRMR